MRGTVEKILNGIAEFFKKLTRKEKVRLVILAVIVLALGITVTAILGRTTYSVLYTGLSSAEAGQILTVLQGMGEDAQAQGTGTILVPEGRVSELRMTLESQGYQTGGYDYSLFDQASGFGMTDLEKQTLIQYQLEAHVRTQLLMMTKISDCLVKISLPKESLFVLSTESSKASGSVTLVVTGGGKLTQSEVNAVSETVIKAVPGLTAENLTIADSNMNLYKTGDDTDISGDVTGQLVLKQAIQSGLEEQALNVTTPIFGVESIRVSVNAVLSFDDVVTESIDFEPPVEGMTEGLAISAYELWEISRADGTAEGVVGTDSNGMGDGTEYPYGTLEDGEVYKQNIRETNYELDKTTTQIREAKGKITNLSVAIVIDSLAVAEDYTQSVKNLVASAIGVDSDYISVERLPFSDTSASIAEALAEQSEFMQAMQQRELIEKGITWGLVVILVLVFLLFVRSIVRSARRPIQPAAQIAGVGVEYLASEDLLADVLGGSAYKDIKLSAKPENVANLESLIDRDAGSVAQLLRNWITDD